MKEKERGRQRVDGPPCLKTNTDGEKVDYKQGNRKK
jgi:hypothetical protein